MPCRPRSLLLPVAVAAFHATWLTPDNAAGQVCNIKVVTDASPDYYDLPSMVHSITGRWATPEEKCWAMFYWNHLARRQTSPMILHGLELTDPIRQFNDYGYTMCSTVAGVNCGIWRQLGLPIKFWDISLHTVSECFYGGRWHMYDNSMSAIYTLCDGVTIAGVEDIGRAGACAASGGKTEPGHIAKYHCLNATSPNGFLTGADTPRDLAQEFRCFNPAGLKHRWYYHNWDWGHRYVLNLREGEVYTRTYHSLGKDRKYFVPNRGKDPEAANPRYRIRGNGVWTFQPRLTPAVYQRFLQSAREVEAVFPAGLQPARAGAPGSVVFKIQSANVTASQTIQADFLRRTARDAAAIEVSTNNGLTWTKVWQAAEEGPQTAQLELIDEVSGAYEILVRVTLQAAAAVADVRLQDLKITTTTMLNSKTQPALRLGQNTVYVDLGDQSDTVVLWPELQNGGYQPYVVQEQNIATAAEHPGYQGVLFAARPREEAFLVYKLATPADMTRLTYGGRFYNRAPQATIRLAHSLDAGQTWTETYRLTSTESPWDVIHYETVGKVPAGTRSALVKYSLNASEAGRGACSIYAMRLEANHQPVAPGFKPLEVTFRWNEVQRDRALVPRSHTQRVEKTPFRYTIHTGGADHPLVESLQLNLAGTEPATPSGYSDGREAGGERFADRWVTYGRNVLAGKPYTVSTQPTGQWGGSDPEGKKLTDGIVGPPYAGGIAPQTACLWDEKSGQPEITVDLGQVQAIGAVRVALTAGWPWWDALRGEVKDRIEVFTSPNGRQYVSHGQFDFDLRRKDIPINHLMPDDETARGFTFTKLLPTPVPARYVRFKVTPQRILGISEVQALDFVKYEPFDLRIALPDEKVASSAVGAGPSAVLAVRGARDPAPGPTDRSQESGRPAVGDFGKVARPAPSANARPAPSVNANAVQAGELVEELPTLRCLGVRWLIGGDANRNARVAVQFRQRGAQAWQPGLDLFRVESQGLRDGVRPPDGQTLYAGSVFGLRENTAYEVKLALIDPEGGGGERIVPMTTWAEPRWAADSPAIEAAPDNLPRVLETLKPGQAVRLRSGVYRGPWRWKSGTPEAPIGVVAAGDGEVVLDGGGGDTVIGASGLHDVIFEGLTIRNATWGIAVNEVARITVRRCTIADVENGFVAQRNGPRQQRFLLADNTIVGRATWPRTRGVEERGGIRLGGSGHVVCYNRIRGFADAVSVHPSYPCAAIDFYGNDISECTDDGLEMDYSEHNTRCFENRLTNVFQGISLQPVHGGPVYVFRNALLNVGQETFKLHNGPSGALLFHNTSVKAGMPWELMTGEAVSNCVSRNNLFVGTAASYAFENTAPMQGCDFDYDGFAGRWKLVLKWNKVRYPSLDDMQASAPVYRHLVQLDAKTLFQSGRTAPDDTAKQYSPKENDLRLGPHSSAVDAGVGLPNVNDAFVGDAPDLGAYEAGQTLPHYGPRATREAMHVSMLNPHAEDYPPSTRALWNPDHHDAPPAGFPPASAVAAGCL